MVDGSGDAPEAVSSPCGAGQRVTAEAARGPGAGAKGAYTRGKLAPPWQRWCPSGRFGAQSPSLVPGKGVRRVGGGMGLLPQVVPLPAAPPSLLPPGRRTGDLLPILGLASLVAFPTDPAPLYNPFSSAPVHL